MTAEGGDDRASAYWEGDNLILRGSMIGSSLCQLVAPLLGHEPAPHPDFLLERFAEGNRWEGLVLERMQKLGWQFNGQAQSEHELQIGPKTFIRCHPDEVGRPSMLGEDTIVEVKALADSSMETIRAGSTADLPWGYGEQISAMMRCKTLPSRAIWVAVPKGLEGKTEKRGKKTVAVDPLDHLHFEEVHAPPMPMKWFVERGMKIREWVDKGEVPGGCDAYPCPFHYLHDAKDDDSDDVDEQTAEEIVRWSSWYVQQAEHEQVAKERKNEARTELLALMKGAGAKKVYEGGFSVTMSQRESKRLDRKAVKAAGIDLSEFEKASFGDVLKVESGWSAAT